MAAVPNYSAVQDRAGENFFRIGTARRAKGTWNAAHMNRQTLENTFVGAALGVCTEGNRSGPLADQLSVSGLPVTMMVEPGETVSTVSLRINGGTPQIMPIKDAL